MNVNIFFPSCFALDRIGRRDDPPATHPKQSLLFGELIYSMSEVYKVIKFKGERNGALYGADGFERILMAPADSLHPAAEWLSWVITISITQHAAESSHECLETTIQAWRLAQTLF